MKRATPIHLSEDERTHLEVFVWGAQPLDARAQMHGLYPSPKIKLDWAPNAAFLKCGNRTGRPVEPTQANSLVFL
jgi:hypothetical protein